MDWWDGVKKLRENAGIKKLLQVDFQLLNEKGETSSFIANGGWALLGEFLLQLETKVREYFTEGPY